MWLTLMRMVLKAMGSPSVTTGSATSRLKVTSRSRKDQQAGLFRQCLRMTAALTVFPSTVAMAAPVTPMWKRRMKTGSRAILVKVPARFAIMDALAAPSARIRFIYTLENRITGAPRAMTRR